MKTTKVLISLPQQLIYGGVQNYVFNLISHMDLTDLEIDVFFSQNIVSSDLAEKFRQHKINLIVGNNIGNNKKINIKNISALMKKNHYDVIHVNTGDLSYTAINMWLAKKYGIKKRIAHSHNAVVSKYKKLKILHLLKNKLDRKIINNRVTNRFACSKVAGYWLFGKTIFEKKGTVQNNGLDPEKFHFNQEDRKNFREKLGIPQNSQVLGLTAYFNAQKNHSYLIKIFAEYLKLNPKAILLLIGDGELKDKIIQQISQLKITDNVIIAPSSAEGHKYYSVMDFFVMPSIYEGLPFVGIEAQLNGLPVLFSDAITKDVSFNENTYFLSNLLEPKIWADKIFSLIKEYPIERRLSSFEITKNNLEKKGYNVKICAEKIRQVYLKNISN